MTGIQKWVTSMWRTSWFCRAALFYIVFWLILTFAEFGFMIHYMHTSGNGVWWSGTEGPYPPYWQLLAAGMIPLGAVAILVPPRNGTDLSPTRVRLVGALLALSGLLGLLGALSDSVGGWLTLGLLWLGLLAVSSRRWAHG